MYHNIISTSDLASHINDPDWLVIDCRFEFAGVDNGYLMYLDEHIPGAIYANLNLDLASKVTPTSGRHPLPTEENFRYLLSNWGVEPDTQIVCYDSEGGAMAAGRCWWLLQISGHRKAAVLDGGFPAWLLEDRTTQSGMETPRKSTQVPQLKFNSGSYLSTAEVEKIRKDPTWLLLDTRNPARFRGMEELVDTTAGHIPGAIHLPYASVMQTNGKLIPVDEIIKLHQQVAREIPPERTVVYCGSGVTSIELILAFAAAGIHGVKLYPGSWSEWIRDPNHQIAVALK